MTARAEEAAAKKSNSKAAAISAASGAGAGAGSSSSSCSSSSAVAAAPVPAASPAAPLPPLIAPTEAVNSVKLSVPGGASAAGELYGAKIATLLRRLRRLPPGDKAVVATSWPRLRPVVAAALRAEGIDAVVLEGTPAQVRS